MFALCVHICEPGIMADSDDDFEGRRNVRGRSRRNQVEEDEEEEEEEEEVDTAEGDGESGSDGGEVSPNTVRSDQPCPAPPASHRPYLLCEKPVFACYQFRCVCAWGWYVDGHAHNPCVSAWWTVGFFLGLSRDVLVCSSLASCSEAGAIVGWARVCCLHT